MAAANPNYTGPRFIVFEGGEGSGKTTALKTLADVMENRGLDVVRTSEPGGTPEGLALRALLLQSDAPDWDPHAELLLMMAARVQHLRKVIRPALAAGRIVLCDRFVGSTLAYQGGGRGVPEQLILDLHRSCAGNIWPDLTILLDVDVATGLSRSDRRLKQAGSSETKFEALDLAFHERVRATFLKNAALSTTLIVDANHAPEIVAAAVQTGVSFDEKRETA